MINQKLAESSDKLLGILGALVDDFKDDKHAYIQKRHIEPLLTAFTEYVEAINEELDRDEPEAQADDEPAEESDDPTLT